MLAAGQLPGYKRRLLRKTASPGRSEYSEPGVEICSLTFISGMEGICWWRLRRFLCEGGVLVWVWLIGLDWISDLLDWLSSDEGVNRRIRRNALR